MSEKIYQFNEYVLGYDKGEILKKLKIEANDIKDRIEDLTNCYKKGTVDEIIKEQESELKKINNIIEELEKQND